MLNVYLEKIGVNVDLKGRICSASETFIHFIETIDATFWRIGHLSYKDNI